MATNFAEVLKGNITKKAPLPNRMQLYNYRTFLQGIKAEFSLKLTFGILHLCWKNLLPNKASHKHTLYVFVYLNKVLYPCQIKSSFHPNKNIS